MLTAPYFANCFGFMGLVVTNYCCAQQTGVHEMVVQVLLIHLSKGEEDIYICSTFLATWDLLS
jgi:hypothetical protein